MLYTRVHLTFFLIIHLVTIKLAVFCQLGGTHRGSGALDSHAVFLVEGLIVKSVWCWDVVVCV